MGIALIAGSAIANAALNIPPREMPGRERFTPSRVDCFNDPLSWLRHGDPRRGDGETPQRSKAC